jgi:exodeoxyribonuclease VII small subunit
MSNEPTFKEAYGVLQKHAQALREQREPNIDDLLQIVTESVAAYKVCQDRISAVEKALEATLASVADEPGQQLPEDPGRG